MTAESGPRARIWLAVGLAVVVVVVVVLARLAGDTGPGAQTAPTPDPEPGNDSVVELQEASAAPAPAAVRVATDFTREWLQHPAGESARQWWQRVSPYAEPGFARQLELTDPARVPASALRGEATAISVSHSRAVFRFETDAGAVLVTCVQLRAYGAPESKPWKVSDIAPADADADAAG